MAGAFESFGQPRPVGVDVVVVGAPQLHQILTGTGPAVVEDHGFSGVEHRATSRGQSAPSSAVTKSISSASVAVGLR
ncbi:hypothetical protein I553_3329 [Mycobacterium xenopi 4042]|uniref:Uncharacterized protein n=1 Tax=Mycobacterium xenopi 4042 TaxID=1299334 RepID=X7YWB5_MYCXE|nr:hypothetical protein I553_3329 [Mycobacterium xenopi 4042]